MKMAKSTTKNATQSKFDIEKISRFTREELDKITDTNADLPLCYQLGGDTYIVGKLRVNKLSDSEWRVVENDEIFDFCARKHAIFYCIAVHKHRYDLAKQIKEYDGTLNKLEVDAIHYRRRYNRAIENNDPWNEELFSNRYQDTMVRISQAKEQLKKYLNLAKYI